MSLVNSFDLIEFDSLNNEAVSTVFSVPRFSGFVAEKKLLEVSVADSLVKDLIELEPRIKKFLKNKMDEPFRDFILNGYRFYDLLDFSSDTNLDSVFAQVIKEASLLLECFGEELVETSAHSWLNILRKGQKVTSHCHQIEDKLAVSYVLFLTDSETKFQLEIPHFFRLKSSEKVNLRPRLAISPEKGKLVLFPSWLFHSTKTHICNDVRVSIAGTIDIKNS